MTERRQVSCPRCGTRCLYAPSNPFRPFCSERCKQVDLGAWATESYRVEATPPQEADPSTEDASLPPHRLS